MKIGFQYMIFAFFMAACLSCEEDYVLYKEEFKPSIVVNAIFKDKSPWIVNLTFSKDIFSSSGKFLSIENANVVVIEKSNNREIPLTHIGNGKYFSEIFPPEPDRTYQLRVSVPGYDLVTAVSNAPKKAIIRNVISEYVNRDVTKVNFEIDNNVNSYYIWNVIATNKKNPIDSSFNGDASNLINGVVKYNNIAQFIKTALEGEKNDAVSGGGKYSANLVNPDIIDDSETGSGQTETVKKYLRLVTSSKELYTYYKTVEKFVSANNHNSSFTYSPEIYSNIENGLGIFAGYTEEYKEVK